MKPKKKTNSSPWLFFMCKALAWPSWSIVYPRHYHYMPGAFKRSKIQGGGVIICNHNRWLEPPLIAYTFPFRSVYSIVANIVLSTKWWKWFFKHMNTIVINRDGFDWKDLKLILSKLEQQNLVLIFPESKINLTDELLEFKDGAAAMAYRANVPIYPIYVYPKRQALHVQHIMIGKPIHLHKEFDKLDQNTVKVMTKKLYDYVHLMKEKLEKELA